MTSPQVSSETAAEATAVTGVPMRFEVTTIPVADVDRAKAFYQSLGWRLDIDFKPTPQTRGVQFTPPGSPASIQFGEGTTTMEPGSFQNMILVVEDLEATREDLSNRGVEVSDIFHLDLDKGPQPGPDPEGKSYANRATFSDPDGNVWQLQEIKERLPGRGWGTSVEALSQLLHETAVHHGAFEAASPPHEWPDWYAAYADARQNGSTPDQADEIADRYMANVKGVVAQRK
jgi:catechol 2,3-dioxygenase-like lactoylglutathione lyase family enzyme